MLTEASHLIQNYSNTVILVFHCLRKARKIEHGENETVFHFGDKSTVIVQWPEAIDI